MNNFVQTSADILPRIRADVVERRNAGKSSDWTQLQKWGQQLLEGHRKFERHTLGQGW